MYATQTPPEPAPSHERDIIGRVLSVGGSSATIELAGSAIRDAARATVGKFLGVVSGEGVIIGMVTEISEQPGARGANIARIDLFGEVRERNGVPTFSRGITDYPAIGEPALLMANEELRLIYSNTRATALVGTLRQDPSIQALVDVDELLNKHFAILGTTGVGKSSGVAIILQQILAARPDLRTFLVDPHNEYGRCFGDRAQVLNPRNLRLPFWLSRKRSTRFSAAGRA